MSSGSPPTLWCDLIVAATRLVAARLDHVRVERALDEVVDLAELPRLLLEDADELLADRAALLLGIGDAGEPAEEALLRVDVDERDVEVVAERLDDLHGLVLAQQAVIDEDARELVAHRLVDEERRDRRVHPARERAQHALRPRPARGSARPAPRSPRRPSRSAARRRPSRGSSSGGRCRSGVCTTSGWNCTPYRRALRVLERRDRRRLRRRDDACARRRRGHRVAVAHPADLLLREVRRRARRPLGR